MNNLFSLLLSVLISVIVAILSFYCMADVSIMNSILFGLLSFFIVHVIVTSFNSEKLSKDITEIKAILIAERLVKAGNNFDYYWMSCIEKARKGKYKLISENCIEIPQPEFRIFWQKALINADKKWDCTHYVKVHRSIDYRINEGFEMQGYLMKTFSLPVRRLFIFDKLEDIIKDELEHIKLQQSIGVDTKILLLENKKKWSGYDRLIKELGTIDIAIVNEAYLMSFVIKKQRSLNYVNFSSEPEKIKIVSQIYTDMWDASSTIQQIEEDLVS